MMRILAPLGIAALLLAGVLVPGTARPALAATIITVKSTGDSAVCTAATMTLRCALTQANTDGSGDTIKFNIPKTDTGCQGTPLVCMIQPATALPTLTASNTTIDGYTQLGASPNTSPLAPFPNPENAVPVGTTPGAYGDNARLVIQLDGTLTPSSPTCGDGLLITGTNNTVRGLSITNFCEDAIHIFGSGIGAGGNKIQGNFLGLLPNGTESGDRHTGTVNFSSLDGVDVDSVSGTATLIGGPLAANTNVISGNNDGILDFASSASIQRNFIGTDRSGGAVAPNVNDGIFVQDAHDVTIGGSTYQTRNILGGNGVFGGVQESGIYETDSDRTTIAGNFVGTDVTGTVSLSNGQDGITLSVGRHTTIGGPATASINVLSGNNSEGVDASTEEDLTVQNDFIGVDVTGKRALGNDDPGIVTSDLNTTDVNSVCTVANPHCHPARFLHNTISGQGADDDVRANGDWGDVFKGNLLGTDNLGRNPVPFEDDGLALNSMHYTVIGGTGSGDGNVIANAGYDPGIDLSNSDHTTIQGNNVGTDITGTKKMGNGNFCAYCDNGIAVNNSSSTVVGGTSTQARNLIVNSGIDGVFVNSSSDTTIQGNWIGVGANGARMGNAINGVDFRNVTGTNLVGGTAAGAANRIAYNLISGVTVRGSSSKVAVRANNISWNGDLGIDLDPLDAVSCSASDGGAPTANGGQNCPVITGATTSNVHGTDSTNGDVVDVFVATNEADDTNPGGGTLHGEGVTYLGSATVSGGVWSLPIGVGKLGHGQWVTATSTSGVSLATPNGTATSEFALNFKVP
jgi:hypothetical protein